MLPAVIQCQDNISPILKQRSSNYSANIGGISYKLQDPAKFYLQIKTIPGVNKQDETYSGVGDVDLLMLEFHSQIQAFSHIFKLLQSS
jgi:hypothetical protein